MIARLNDINRYAQKIQTYHHSGMTYIDYMLNHHHAIVRTTISLSLWLAVVGILFWLQLLST